MIWEDIFASFFSFTIYSYKFSSGSVKVVLNKLKRLKSIGYCYCNIISVLVLVLDKLIIWVRFDKVNIFDSGIIRE